MIALCAVAASGWAVEVRAEDIQSDINSLETDPCGYLAAYALALKDESQIPEFLKKQSDNIEKCSQYPNGDLCEGVRIVLIQLNLEEVREKLHCRPGTSQK